MKAILMAGGKGTRLYPYSALLPKPLMPLGDMPVMELLLRQLRRAGIEEAFIAVNHLRHLIEAFFGDGSRMGMRLNYTLEDTPLGTAGAIGSIIDQLGERFIMANGDLLTSLDVAGMIRFHARTGAHATMGVYPREVKIEFGLIEVDEDMRMRAYHEKPRYEHLVSMGIYVLDSARVRPHVKPGVHLDMPDLLLRMAGAGSDIRCFQDKCFWLDIGRPDDFALAQEMYERDPKVFLGPDP